MKKEAVKKAKATTTPVPIPITEKSTAIVPASTTALMQHDENGRAYYSIPFELKPEGGENADVRLTLPRMKVLQTNSVECKKETRIAGAEEGLFYNTSTGELHDELNVVPLYVFQERYYNVPKMSNNMVCTSRDGKGLFGVCLKGDYETHRIPSKIIKDDTGREMEVGICDRCPHAARMFGGQSDCQHSKIIVFAPYDFIQQWSEILPRIEKGGDDELVSDVINALFILGFRSTNLKVFTAITDQSARDLSYFRWNWVFNTVPMSNDKGSWHGIHERKSVKLTPDEIIFARSLYKLSKKIRPTISDVETVEESEELTAVGEM